MPDSVADLVYWIFTGVLAICLGFIGWSLKEGFTRLVDKLEKIDNAVRTLTEELQQEREERRVSYAEVLGRVNKVESICAERHRD